MNTTPQPALVAPRRRSGVIFALAVFVIVALIILLALGLMQRSAPPLAAGAAPSFQVTSFEGQTYRLEDLRGKAIVLNFWASWCQPCRDEAPLLQAVWRENRSGDLLVLGIDYVDTDPEAKKYIAEFKIDYPNGPDLGTKISQAYRTTGVPETYFITRDGKLLSGSDANGRAYANWIGPITETALRERVKRLLAK